MTPHNFLAGNILFRNKNSFFRSDFLEEVFFNFIITRPAREQ